MFVFLGFLSIHVAYTVDLSGQDGKNDVIPIKDGIIGMGGDFADEIDITSYAVSEGQIEVFVDGNTSEWTIYHGLAVIWSSNINDTMLILSGGMGGYGLTFPSYSIVATIYRGAFSINLFRQDTMYDRFVWNGTGFTSNTLENVSVGTIGTNKFSATIPASLRSTLSGLNTSIYGVYYSLSEGGGGSIDAVNNKLDLGTAQMTIDTIYMDMAEDTSDEGTNTSSGGTDTSIPGFNFVFLASIVSLISIIIVLKKKIEFKNA
ncbi:MAG: hypothetical protein JW891_14315 [Candidatus Lokiarchaeota archaeon]|nr:hypothetical protein [Candidatus Lokiarchaeota archaeon]